MNRPNSIGLDVLLEKEIKVLDHGFIRVVDYMGNDAAIVQAARVSYGAGTKTVREDEKLISYLMRNNHNTPFEMCEIKLHCKMPIFVARQWIRHRTANVNEYSARYSVLDKEFYIPEEEHLGLQSKSNKQGREDSTSITQALMDAIRNDIRNNSESAYAIYERMLEYGVSREISRMVLPFNIYTQWYWKIDLHNLLHFLELRCDPHAQYEIRVYAEEIMKVVEAWVPTAAAAFKEHRVNG